MNFKATVLAALSCAGMFTLSCGGSGSMLVVKGSSSATASRLSVRSQSAVGGSPTSFGVTFYAIYVSPNADCSDPILVADFGADGKNFDLTTNPTLVEAEVAEGSYECVVAEISDIQTFTPDSAAVAAHAGICEADTTYTYDIYRSDDGDAGFWVDRNGDYITATGTPIAPGADRVTAFNTTGPLSGVSANGVTPHAHQLGGLDSPLVVPGQTTFYIDASDKVSDWPYNGTPLCWLEQPVSGFR